MKLIKSTLEAVFETWDDPGDYPNALAQGPLPSYTYLEGLEGKVVVDLCGEDWHGSDELADSDIDSHHPELADILNGVIPSVHEDFSICVYKWDVRLVDGKLEIEAIESETC